MASNNDLIVKTSNAMLEKYTFSGEEYHLRWAQNLPAEMSTMCQVLLSCETSRIVLSRVKRTRDNQYTSTHTQVYDSIFRLLKEFKGQYGIIRSASEDTAIYQSSNETGCLEIYSLMGHILLFKILPPIGCVWSEIVPVTYSAQNSIAFVDREDRSLAIYNSIGKF